MEFFLFLIAIGLIIWYIWFDGGTPSSSQTYSPADIVGVIVIFGVVCYLGYQAFHQAKRKRT